MCLAQTLGRERPQRTWYMPARQKRLRKPQQSCVGMKGVYKTPSNNCKHLSERTKMGHLWCEDPNKCEKNTSKINTRINTIPTNGQIVSALLTAH